MQLTNVTNDHKKWDRQGRAWTDFFCLDICAICWHKDIAALHMATERKVVTYAYRVRDRSVWTSRILAAQKGLT